MKHSSAPAYSLGLKYPAEPVTTNKLAPSPDTYNVRNENLTVPSVRFAKSSRNDSSHKVDLPGPGAYYIPTFVDQVILTNKNRPVLSVKEKRERIKVESPGPGSFHPQSHQKSLSYSMGSKAYSLSGSAEFVSVGPDNYSPNFKSIEPVKPISFTKAQRETELSVTKNPGPGHYDPSYFLESPRYTFPIQERGRLPENHYPSPQAYVIQSFIEDANGKGATVIPKREVKRTDGFVPGPGSYDAKLPQIFPSFSVGKGKRPEVNQKIQSPGPAEYSPSSNTSPGKSIGKGKRPPINFESLVPGPGAYESKSYTLNGPKVTLVPRRENSNKDLQMPGPGHYSPEFKSAKGKSFSAVMGSAKRKFEEDTKGVPGPGTYERSRVNDSPGWSFRKSAKTVDKSLEIPGPGSYEFLVSVPDAPKYLINNKIKS